MEFDLIVAGHGGQGVLFIGRALAQAALDEGKEVVWFPSYGGEMRGGFANCIVVISSSRIASPYRNKLAALIAMNRPSLERFQVRIREGGLILYNSSIVSRMNFSSDLRCYGVPFNELAEQLGNMLMASAVAVGAFVELTGIVKFESVERALKKIFADRKNELIQANLQALRQGALYVRTQLSRKSSVGEEGGR